MKKIKTYNQFKESLLIDLSLQDVRDLLESLNIWHDALLLSIGAKPANIYDELKLDPERFKDIQLDIITDDNSQLGIEFINSLTSLGLKKSTLENTDDYQTFLNNSCRFVFIYKSNSYENLEIPSWILIQSFVNDKWGPTEFYEWDKDVTVKKFDDKLTSRTVEINDGDDNYIYVTNNANEWELQNVEKENDVYKRLFRKEEFEDLVNNRKVKIDVLG